VVDFIDGLIATLRIHSKLRLKTKSERLAGQILACDYRQYKLMSHHGRISSRFQGDELNEVNSNSVDILSGDILMELEYKAGKEVIIPLSLAVARENNQGSITSAHRARRATTALGSGSGSALANSLVRQRRRRRDPSPKSSPERQLEPVRARNRRVVKERQPEPIRTRKRRAVEERQPEPVKTRKRRAVEDAGQVDLGPRKLRSRK
jgi:hypothetical protein